MAFSRPTLGELVTRVQGDIETLLEGADAKLRVFTEYALGFSLAGVAHGLHGHLVHISRQLFPDTAKGPYLRDRKSTRLNSRHIPLYRMPSAA